MAAAGALAAADTNQTLCNNSEIVETARNLRNLLLKAEADLYQETGGCSHLEMEVEAMPPEGPGGPSFWDAIKKFVKDIFE